ncbi:MAG: DUF6794 domain-containing protein [Saprospiraceae bacterium]|nr:hypothetical protein [Saprospiraceae bacterium]MDW8228533.1 DUF6794 domain-containing protein [Saprospiraceae bacterium]
MTPVLSQKEYRPADTEEEFQRRYQERIKKDQLNGVYIPKNLDEAIAQLYKWTDESQRQRIRSLPEDSVCMRLHSKLGQRMIFDWGFYEGSRLSHYLRSAGVTFPDDMADFLILAFHRHLNNHPIEVRQLATYFKEKRRKEWQERLSKGEVIHREVRKRPRPDSLQTTPTVGPAIGSDATAKKAPVAKGQ